MKNIPTRIFLQIPTRIFLQIEENAGIVNDFEELEEVTWCSERINDNDLEYILVAGLHDTKGLYNQEEGK